MLPLCGRGPDSEYVRLTPWRLAVSYVALAVVAVLAVDARAEQRVPLTLAEAEDLALRSEPGQVAMLAQALALEEQSVVAGQLPDPTLRLGLANFPVGSGSFSTEGMTQAQLGIRQAFPRGKSRSLSTAHFRALAEAQNEGANARSREVLAATRVAWLETYYWQRAQLVLTESRPFFEDLVEVTQSMYSVGRKTQYDVLRAELELSRLDDRLIDAARSRSMAQSQLSQWLGNDAYRPAAPKLPQWGQLPGLDELRQGLARHPTLHAADAELSARQSGVDIAEENRKPGWALDFGYGYREGFLPNGEPRADFVSLSVTVDLPVFKKNRQDRKLSAALSERRAARANKDDIAARLRSELESEFARWQELTRRMALYETQILRLSQDQAEAALLAYQSDAGDFSDVMLGHIDNLNARLQHVRLRVERAQSHAVLANLGGVSL